MGVFEVRVDSVCTKSDHRKLYLIFPDPEIPKIIPT